jgi:hypothetical protein
MGRFLFINTTPEGEVFGSGDPDINSDITMYIESAELSERHADIKFFPTQFFQSMQSNISGFTNCEADSSPQLKE